VRAFLFYVVSILVGGLFFAFARWLGNDYLFFAGYTVLQFIVLATAWNILGGYCGYVNFGSAAFFAAGAYSSVALHKLAAGIDRYFPESLAGLAHAILPLPIPVLIVIGGLVAGLIGLGTGYLTLRFRGVYFAIATLGLVVVLETLVHNISALGGASGMAVYGPRPPAWSPGPSQYNFSVMLVIAVASVALARFVEISWIGRGLRAVRASEDAAECSGVPTLRLKLLACALSGAVLAAAGAPYPFYTSFVEPVTAFSLIIGLNAIAMPLIGGTKSWAGPVLGALLLASVQQIATVNLGLRRQHEGGDDGGIDRVGLGPAADGMGIGAHLRRIDDQHRRPCR